jgi:RNA 3'-phosphate cyclase
MILIDGSHGEGGGQIIRTALALSTLTGLPFRAERIRSGRPKPGLKAQHLAAIEALRRICKAKTNTVGLGSETLEYAPGPVQAGVYSIDIGTAGSISLLLQALFLPLAFASGDSILYITGGTCGRWQAPAEYTGSVLLPYLSGLAQTRLAVKRRGYYPQGGGKVKLDISPKFQSWKEVALAPFQILDKGKLLGISGISHASESLRKAQVADRQAVAAASQLRRLGCPVKIDVDYHPTLCPGSGIVLWAEYEHGDLPHPLISGVDELGKKGKKAERVGEEAAAKLLMQINTPSPVDEFLADQLIPFLGLLPGSAMRAPMVTDHLLSNIYAVEQFLPVRFSVEGEVVRSGQ